MPIHSFGPESALAPSASFAVRGQVLESPVGRKYLAEGDGRYEDGRLLQRAVDDLAAAGGGELEIVGGATYALAQALHIPAGVHLRGRGGRATLRAENAAVHPLIAVDVGATDVLLANLICDGQGGPGPLVTLGAGSCGVTFERLQFTHYTGAPWSVGAGACDPDALPIPPGASNDRVDVRDFLTAAYAAGIDGCDGASHPLSTVYADAAAIAAAFPKTTTFVATLGWQPPQPTDELAWAAIQEALETGWQQNKACYAPMGMTLGAGVGGYLINRTLVMQTGGRLVGDAVARWGTQIKASPTFRNRKASGATDTNQCLLRAYNAGGPNYKIDYTARVYVEWIDLHGGDVRPVIRDGIMTAGSATLQSDASTFTADMLGAFVSVLGADANGGTYSRQILSVTDPHRVVLGTPAIPYAVPPTLDTPVNALSTVTNATVINSAEQVSGSRFLLQQASTIRQCFAEHFSGFGWWLEGQDSRLERSAAFFCEIGLRARNAQFITLDAFNPEVYYSRGLLIEASVAQSTNSVWMSDLHAENQDSPYEDTWLCEVTTGNNVTLDAGHFTQWSGSTPAGAAGPTAHNGFLVTGAAGVTSLDVRNLRNTTTSAMTNDGAGHLHPDRYAIRDYARGVDLLWSAVGRQFNYAGVRSPDSGQASYSTARIYAAGGKRLDLMGAGPAQPLLSLIPGALQTGDSLAWRDTAGVVQGGVDALGRLHGQFSGGVNGGLQPISSLRGGFGPGQNYCKDSHDLTLWTRGSGFVAAGGTVAGGQAAPDGSATAALIDFMGALGNSFIRNVTGVGGQQGKTQCGSIWLRADTADLAAGDGTLAVRMFVVTPFAYTPQITTAWQRFWFLATIPGGETSQVLFELIRTAGTHLNRVYAWGGQVEEATAPGPLVRVVGSTPHATATPGLLAGASAYAAIGGFASGSATFDFPDLAVGAATSTAVAVAGLVDDGTWTCQASLRVAAGVQPAAGFLFSAFPDPVTPGQAIVTVLNQSGASRNLGSGTLRVNAIKVAT